jgi:hypothetical protein
MRIQLHLPRKSEAELSPEIDADIYIRPRFYKRTGTVPVLYLSTIDAFNKMEHYVLLINATSKNIRCEKLVEVAPACNEYKRKESKDVTTHNETNEDENVRGTDVDQPG